MARDKEKDPGKEMPKDKENSCLGCGKRLTNTHCHQCIICGLWIHKGCSGISDEFFKHLEDQVKNTGSAYWACRPCSTYSQGITKKMRAVETKVDQIKDSVEEVKDTLTAVKTSVEQVGSRVKKIEEAAASGAENNNNIVFQELRERDSRKNNLVIHGLRECDVEGASGKDRQNWDLDLCVKLCQELGVAHDRDVFKFCRRVGSADQGHRPLVLGFYTDMEKSLVLRKVKNIQNTSFENVTVTADLTKRQRQEEKSLWEDKEERNANRTEEQVQKNLEWAVVGARGERRLLLQPSRPPAQHRGAGLRRGRGRPPNRGSGHQGHGRGNWATRVPARPARVSSQQADNEQEEESQEEEGAENIAPTQGRKRNAAAADLEGPPPEKR